MDPWSVGTIAFGIVVGTLSSLGYYKYKKIYI